MPVLNYYDNLNYYENLLSAEPQILSYFEIAHGGQEKDFAHPGTVGFHFIPTHPTFLTSHQILIGYPNF